MHQRDTLWVALQRRIQPLTISKITRSCLECQFVVTATVKMVSVRAGNLIAEAIWHAQQSTLMNTLFGVDPGGRVCGMVTGLSQDAAPHTPMRVSVFRTQASTIAACADLDCLGTVHSRRLEIIL